MSGRYGVEHAKSLMLSCFFSTHVSVNYFSLFYFVSVCKYATFLFPEYRNIDVASALRLLIDVTIIEQFLIQLNVRLIFNFYN